MHISLSLGIEKVPDFRDSHLGQSLEILIIFMRSCTRPYNVITSTQVLDTSVASVGH